MILCISAPPLPCPAMTQLLCVCACVHVCRCTPWKRGINIAQRQEAEGWQRSQYLAKRHWSAESLSRLPLATLPVSHDDVVIVAEVQSPFLEVCSLCDVTKGADQPPHWVVGCPWGALLCGGRLQTQG